MTRPTIMINEVTVPQINAAFLGLGNGLASLSSDLDSDLAALKKNWTQEYTKINKRIDAIIAGTTVYSAGDNINISSTGVISALVYNGTLTINRNGTSLGTFSANQQGSSSVDIIVPTKTSDLNNDSGFITSASIPTDLSDFNNDVGYITSADSITGNAATATNATNDSDGNAINTTYAKKTELYSYPYTFVVKDAATWSTFMAQTSGNNFSRTLIKAGTWSLTTRIQLPADSVIEGETGTIITVSVSTTEVLWQNGTTRSTVIRNITFNNNYPTANGNYRMFRCLTLDNCIINLTSSYHATVGNNSGGIFYTCILRNCTINQTGSYRLFDWRYGAFNSECNNCVFNQTNPMLTNELGNIANSNIVTFIGCIFHWAYTLTAATSTNNFAWLSTASGNQRPKLIGCYFYITNSGGYTLSMNFGSIDMLSVYLYYTGAVSFSHTSSSLATGVIANGSALWP